MKRKKSARAWRGLTGVSATVMAILVAGSTVANANAAFINTRLGTASQKMVDSSTEDSMYYDSEFSSLEDMYNAKVKLAEEIAGEGTVLFKNDNAALPLAKNEKITLWGMNSHYPTLGGMIGSSTASDTKNGQVPVDLEQAFTQKGFTLNQNFIDLYSSKEASEYMRTGFGQPGHGLMPAFTPTYETPAAYPVGEIPADLYTEDTLSSADDTTAVVVISRDSSEAADYEPGMKNATKGDSFERPLALSDYEKSMIDLAKKHSTKVVVLLNADNPMEIDSLKKDPDIDSIVWAGEPGMYGFLGVVDALDGDANPSGKITDTYAVNSVSSPAMQNFGVYTYTNSSNNGGSLTEDNKADWFAVETEGIYDGYKYYETRYEDQVLGQGNADDKAGSSTGDAWDYQNEVSYPFGYGLSYTTFEQKLNSVDVSLGDQGSASVTVTNTGKTAGKDVVELYVQTPYTEGGLEKSAIQLVGFAKTSELAPGASEDVTVSFDPQYMASYDETAKDGNGAWVLDAGDYYFSIGNGAHEALNNVLAKKTGSTGKLEMTTDDEKANPDNAIVWNLDKQDIDTYSKNVSNQLQDADINKQIPDTAEYSTRADWTKGWKTVDSLTPTDEMMTGLTNSKYELTENGDGESWGEDNGLKLIDMVTIKDGKITGVTDINDEKWDKLVSEITLDEAIQFIEKGGDDNENIDSILLPRSDQNDGPLGFTYDQVAGYYIRWDKNSDTNHPTYTTAEDKDGTYADNVMPTEPVVAATFNQELVHREGELLGEGGLWSNVAGIIAPGINLHRVPYNARNHEYYSEDSVLTGTLAVSLCTGIQSKGMYAEPKHLAANHQETNRSGMSVFSNEQGMRENELRGFQMVLSTNSAGNVMTSFNRLGTVFAGANENLLINILRNEWGYEGAVVTDMINGADYMNWRDITFAGGGNCLTTSAYDTSKIGTMAASKALIAKDTAFQKMMKTNIKYWLHTLAGSLVMNGITHTTVLKHVTPWWQAAIYGGIALFAALTVLFAVLYVTKERKLKAVQIVDASGADADEEVKK